MHPVWIGELRATPIGTVWVAADVNALVAISFFPSQEDFVGYLVSRGAREVRYEPEKVAEALGQIEAYLAGRRMDFDLPLPWGAMRPFQARVLQATRAIPYGGTRTYGELAAQVGKPRAARAVGRAEATNPLPIVIPCHRVLGSDGKLHGYSAPGGLATKAWLLELEKRSAEASTRSA